MLRYLDEYKNVEDLMKMTDDELKWLSNNIRSFILQRGAKYGGHIGTNIGNIEMIVSLYSVINPKDSFVVYDGAHQKYTHTILLGKKDTFQDKGNSIYDLTETEYDYVKFGHAGFGASILCGYARATDKQCILVLSDGCISTGIEFEGLNNLSTLNRNVVVVVNDNEHSIMENVGGIYKDISLYLKSFGFEYIYVDDGYDISRLKTAYINAFKINKPTVVHVKTKKG